MVTAVIRASIQARGIEIEVWSLIGATKKFIRAPFIYQGMMEGLSGGVAAFLVSLVFSTFCSIFLILLFLFFLDKLGRAGFASGSGKCFDG